MLQRKGEFAVLRADNETLRRALRRILDVSNQPLTDSMAAVRALGQVSDLAWQALRDEQPEPESQAVTNGKYGR
jgi:hypothetical protein